MGNLAALDEAGRIEVAGHVGITPINRQRAGHHGLRQFFRDVTGERVVFEGDVEFSWAEGIDFSGIPAQHRAADVVMKTPARFQPALIFESFSKISTRFLFRRGLLLLTTNRISFCRPVSAPATENYAGTAMALATVQHDTAQPQMARIIQWNKKAKLIPEIGLTFVAEIFRQLKCR